MNQYCVAELGGAAPAEIIAEDRGEAIAEYRRQAELEFGGTQGWDEVRLIVRSVDGRSTLHDAATGECIEVG